MIRFFVSLLSNRLFVSAAKTLLVLGVFWVLFYTVHELLPYVKSGVDVIYEAKTNEMCNTLEFPKGAKYKVVVCGDSKILSGFIPSLFDCVNAEIRSYNLGLPNASNFLFVIENLVQRGQIPTHVFLTVNWPEDQENNRPFALPNDGLIVKKLFPFRKLPRNLTLFLLHSRIRGGVTRFYKFSRDCKEKMLADRGYYFIEEQSEFPDHRLPEGFKVQDDMPDKVWRRNFSKNSSIFKRLIELHEKYNINFYIMPTYYRRGSRAQCFEKSENADVFNGCSGLYVLGPEYYLFSNEYFSDAVHVNPKGAELYTKKLYQLFQENIVCPTTDPTLAKLSRE